MQQFTTLYLSQGVRESTFYAPPFLLPPCMIESVPKLISCLVQCMTVLHSLKKAGETNTQVS